MTDDLERLREDIELLECLDEQRGLSEREEIALVGLYALLYNLRERGGSE